MLGENLAAFVWLYARPLEGFSRILDRGRLWLALVLTLVVSFLVSASNVFALGTSLIHALEMSARNPAARRAMQKASKENPPQTKEEEENDETAVPPALDPSTLARLAAYNSVSPMTVIWSIGVLLVPIMIAARAVSGYGSFGVLMRQDYLSLLMCVLMAWSAAYLPLGVILGIVSYGFHTSAHVLPLFAAALIYFLVLTVLAVRTAFGIATGPATGLTALAGGAAMIGAGLFGVMGFSLLYLASPFYLFYAWRLVGSDVRSLGDGLRSRQHLRNQLEIATNNPRDADAHYQLGLIYQKRRQFSEAISRFQRAVEIDPKEAEPHYQLGRIAREQGRIDDAIGELETAAKLDDKLAQSDVWRELGAAYFAANRVQDAGRALEKYLTRREYDPEGLYWFGMVMKNLGRSADARELFQRAIDSVKTMPSHRRAELRQWSSKAKSEM